MPITTTKEKILAAALELFSENGYSGTNLQSIADSVGLVKSALYRHFSSKEDLWATLLGRISSRYEAETGSAEHLPPVPGSAEELLSLTLRNVHFTTEDETMCKARKILQTEQYRDPTARCLASKRFLTGTQELYSRLFSKMMENGCMSQGNPRIAALAYTAPITVLVHELDRYPEFREAAFAQIEEHVRQFCALWKIR